MKIITRLLFMFFLCLTISCASIAPSATTQPQNNSYKYTFDFYANHLSKGLFPKIEKTIKPYKKFLNSKEGQKAVDEVFECIETYLKKNNLYVYSNPKVQIFQFQNDKVTLFILRVELHFLDEASSIKNYVNTVIFSKKFLIFFGKKLKGVGI